MKGAIPIVALDCASEKVAMELARSVIDSCRFFKVGSTLFTAAGPAIVARLREELAADVFLDLKFHDIPNTVAGAVKSAVSLGVRLVTLHASGGRDMLLAAQDASAGRCGLLGVTVLTSHNAESLRKCWGRGADIRMIDEVLRLAGEARYAGLHGIVCSGHEVAAVCQAFGTALSPLVPGIRLPGSPVHDQERTMTPLEAQRAGARYLVLGRAVTAAPDPAAAMRRVCEEIGYSQVAMIG